MGWLALLVLEFVHGVTRCEAQCFRQRFGIPPSLMGNGGLARYVRLGEGLGPFIRSALAGTGLVVGRIGCFLFVGRRILFLQS